MEAQVGRVAVGSRRKPWRRCTAVKRGLAGKLESEVQAQIDGSCKDARSWK